MSESTDVDGGEQANNQGSEARVAVLEEMLDVAHEEITRLNGRLNDIEGRYEAELEAHERTISQLQQRVAELDERTDMLKAIERADQTDGQQRSATLLQHLKEQAKHQSDRGRSAIASVNHQDTLDALHYPDVHRTAIYHDWDRCVRWIGDTDVCWTGTRDGEKRLFLDLEGVQDGTISNTIHQRSE